MTGRALVDTGSTTSGVRASIARRLDLPRRGKRPMGGVGGEVQLERIIIRIAFPPMADPPSFPFAFDDILGMELFDSFSFDVLLGMDIIGNCDLHVLKAGTATLDYG